MNDDTLTSIAGWMAIMISQFDHFKASIPGFSDRLSAFYNFTYLFSTPNGTQNSIFLNDTFKPFDFGTPNLNDLRDLVFNLYKNAVAVATDDDLTVESRLERYDALNDALKFMLQEILFPHQQ